MFPRVVKRFVDSCSSFVLLTGVFRNLSWPRYIRSFPIVVEIRTLAYRFDRPGSVREERNIWCVPVLSE